MSKEEVPFQGNVKRAPHELEQWLAQVQEDPLLPELPIVDAHIHLWNDARGRYLADDYRSDAAGHNVTSAMFTQCFANYLPHGPIVDEPLGETEFIVRLGQAAENRSQTGPAIAEAIIGFADLSHGEQVRATLERHIEIGAGRFRGIRQGTQYDASSVGRQGPWRPQQGQMYTREFREGFAQLAPLGLTFDAWLFHPQIPDLTALAAAFPDTSIILDHVGAPLAVGPYHGKREAVFGEWQRSLTALAQRPNVKVKIGGLGMILFGFGFCNRLVPPGSEELAQAWKPYVETVIELFGIERCMFESNFPVDAQSCSLGILLNAYKRIAAGYSDDERRHFFSATAKQVYRI